MLYFGEIMKKIIMLLISLLMSFSIFAGCASRPDNKSPDTGDGGVTDLPEEGKPEEYPCMIR